MYIFRRTDSSANTVTITDPRPQDLDNTGSPNFSLAISPGGTPQSVWMQYETTSNTWWFIDRAPPAT